MENYLISALSGICGAVIGTIVGSCFSHWLSTRQWIHRQKAQTYAEFFNLLIPNLQHINPSLIKQLTLINFQIALYSDGKTAEQFMELIKLLNGPELDDSKIKAKLTDISEMVHKEIQKL